MAASTQIGLTARISMTIRRVETEIRKNWLLVVVLVLCDVVSIIPAYLLRGWPSVAATIFFIFLSTVLGYYAITRVVTITTETK
jgi:hypothetical protein